MAIDRQAIAALKDGALYAGRPLNFADEETIARGIAMESTPGAADKFYTSGKSTARPEKGSDEARERMAKVRAAKGKKARKEKASDDGPRDTLVGLLSTKRILKGKGEKT